MSSTSRDLGTHGGRDRLAVDHVVDLEDDCRVAMPQDPVLAVPLHRTREDCAFDFGT